MTEDEYTNLENFMALGHASDVIDMLLVLLYNCNSFVKKG
jgi:hypothetical protein